MPNSPSSPRVSAVCLVLASGRGSRMGGPKALLLWEPATTLVEAHVQARLAECHRVLVVTRDDIAARIRTRRTRAKLIVSDEADDLGPAGSIGAAVASGIFDESGIALITPVDVPPVRTETVHRLLDAVASGAAASRPCSGGRHGHPVAIRADVVAEAYGRGKRPTLRDVLHGLGAGCVDVEVDDPDVLIDLDTPEAFEARTGRPARFA